jgi:hypothetical protein
MFHHEEAKPKMPLLMADYYFVCTGVHCTGTKKTCTGAGYIFCLYRAGPGTVVCRILGLASS